KIIKGSKTRIIGTNCLGVFDGYSQVDTLFLPESKLRRPKEGGISFVSQSGAFGSTLLDLIADQKIGISKFISYGNQVDLKDVDFLKYLGEDEKTKVVVMYMEGVSDGRKFMGIASGVAAKKPVIIFKAGKTSKGSAAAASHTGALAGSYDVYKAAFRQSGIIEAGTIEDIFDFAKALEKQPLPKGNRIAVVTNGGGFGVITSDSIVEDKMELAEFSEENKELLKKILPEYGNVRNPLDLVGDADQER
ncbi:MAG TPA: CoA-binding protein, partial [archaeon]|nr:CoA-binding protein [archaeon]